MFNSHHEINDMESGRRQDLIDYRRNDARVKRLKRGPWKAITKSNVMAKLSFGLIQWGGHSQKE